MIDLEAIKKRSDSNTGERAAWVQAWAAGIAVFIAIGAGVVTYSEFWQRKRENRVEKTQALWQQFNSLEMLSARAQAAKAHPAGSEALFEVFTFFGGLARADELGILSADDVDYYFRDYLLMYWFAYGDWVKQRRRMSGEDPARGGSKQLYGGYQRLVEEILRQPSVHQPTNADIEDFLKIEQKRFADAKAVRAEAVIRTREKRLK